MSTALLPLSTRIPLFREFPSDDQGWQTRIAQIDPKRYALTRNHLHGAVTGLSPYLTHGYLSLTEAAQAIRQRVPLSTDEKLFSEFCWRSFFHHVWSHKDHAIFSDLRPGLSGIGYDDVLPADIRQGRTGLPVIDQAVRQLYTTGYLHNHARMWLASYVIHLRHIHWRAGADWLYSHLLDGDLASNHLSWQWVAGTFSVKPYLFNADNVAKYAPPEWHCAGSPLDTSYEALEMIARGQDRHGQRAFELLPHHPAGHIERIEEPALYHTPPAAPQKTVALTALIELLQSRSEIASLELVHAWALRCTSTVQRSQEQLLRLGVIHLPEHAQWPWSERRWNFVLDRMSQICDVIFLGDLAALQSLNRTKTSLYCYLSAGQNDTMKAISRLNPTWCETTPLVTEPSQLCESFSKYFRHTNKPWSS